MRGSAVWFASQHRQELEQGCDVLFASSYLPLAELHGLVPATARMPSVLYFHENQLAYPVRPASGGRDHHFSFTQLVSALSATAVVFNSRYNRDSFFEAATRLLKRMPDAVPKSWLPQIREKSEVIPLPLKLCGGSPELRPNSDAGPLILWNHRWEYDKNPEVFCDALEALANRDVPFRVAFCGQRFRKSPECFDRAKVALGSRVVVFGHAPRDEYDELLRAADIVVSTAIHEFFGISIVEAIHAGAMPLVPDRLAYQETVSDEFRYASDDEFEARLEALCRRYQAGEVLRADRRDSVAKFEAARVLPHYQSLLERLVARATRP